MHTFAPKRPASAQFPSSRSLQRLGNLETRPRRADARKAITAPANVNDVTAAPGQPLDATTRAYFEPRFGSDFSKVRIHTERNAADSAQAVGARAYTVGRNIIFGAGQYAPSTTAGRKLLAHELTHVLQQREAGSIPRSLEVSSPGAPTERQADGVANAVASSRSALTQITQLSAIAPAVQREPTRPRASTGTQSIADLSAQTAGASGVVTAGSLARTEWESLFRRHFAERDKVENEVESSHARYIYSNIYGWIDAQHFFAHIQFAEDEGLEKATAKGISIEQNQARVRNFIGPDPEDTSIYSEFLEKDLIDAADFLHYQEEGFMAITAAMEAFLGKQEKALLKGFDDEKLAKVILDNAKSAWSYEDLVSNQLGVQFYWTHGAYVNAGKDAEEVRSRFIAKITDFFASIQVVDDAAAIKSRSAKLPGKERWKSPKMSLADARKKYPELFEFDRRTHRLRVVVHDSAAAAERGKQHIEAVAPSVPGLHVEQVGSDHCVYTGVVSHFRAILLKAQLSKAIPINLKSILVEPAPPEPKPKAYERYH